VIDYRRRSAINIGNSTVAGKAEAGESGQCWWRAGGAERRPAKALRIVPTKSQELPVGCGGYRGLRTPEQALGKRLLYVVDLPVGTYRGGLPEPVGELGPAVVPEVLTVIRGVALI
jgi:hypothetical protein